MALISWYLDTFQSGIFGQNFLLKKPLELESCPLKWYFQEMPENYSWKLVFNICHTTYPINRASLFGSASTSFFITLLLLVKEVPQAGPCHFPMIPTISHHSYVQEMAEDSRKCLEMSEMIDTIIGQLKKYNVSFISNIFELNPFGLIYPTGSDKIWQGVLPCQIIGFILLILTHYS